MSQKVAIFGSSGQLGVELCSELASRGYLVAGFERARIDITDRSLIERSLAEIDPSIVVNASAYNQVDVAETEPQAAFAVNALGVRNLALACRQIDARLVHFSTDYVFDGESGRAYTEDDVPHPLGAYAVSKYAGELYARAYLDDPLLIRTSGVFGPAGAATRRGNFVELMLRLAAGSQPIRVVDDHVASPTYAPLLAARTADLIERKLGGVFHVAGGTPISWFDFASAIFRARGLEPELRATTAREYRTPARRPRYSALSNAKMESAGLEPMPSVERALDLYFSARIGA
ncbi:MAG: dTDP-4-dehydrorhamnose reductase [Bryobacterales bacterium]|nr:dTDP-4-dehydrorhamnose reductase [Bryobacterales bacterium]